MNPEEIPVLVTTGGPCGGKSTGLALLRQKLLSHGVTPIVVPELATQLFTNGIMPEKVFSSPESGYEFQRQMVTAQIALEEQWKAFARIQPGEKKVLICDRGALDPRAYIDDEKFGNILSDLEYSITDLRDRRYTAVLHLVTAAQGAEEFYNLDNEARTETPEQARSLDDSTLGAWMGHPRHFIIGNTVSGDSGVKRLSFEEKMNLFVENALAVIGIQVPKAVERKFRVTGFDPKKLPGHASVVDIDQIYLESLDPAVERRIRRIVPDGDRAKDPLLVYSEKKDMGGGVRVPTQRVIGDEEFAMLNADRDSRRETIRKRRWTFAWKGQHFRLDVILEPVKEMVLEAEIPEWQTTVEAPPFLDISEEVTEAPEFRNIEIARRGDDGKGRGRNR